MARKKKKQLTRRQRYKLEKKKIRAGTKKNRQKQKTKRQKNRQKGMTARQSNRAEAAAALVDGASDVAIAALTGEAPMDQGDLMVADYPTSGGGGGLPSWALPAGIGVAVLVFMGTNKKGKR